MSALERLEAREDRWQGAVTRRRFVVLAARARGEVIRPQDERALMLRRQVLDRTMNTTTRRAP